mmetsp:Transcript_1061/g.2652  ORF Transcript_1061/g.2652 Transcript_1061/m.2652 type:complete len:523 (-) Transcript_1061:1919-3487(-)|eukprot:CAMPEP_0201133010 /NCGR_PEP_ID=MMETSP0850-20130426/47629_1 /ASSEMBLY_ACC=CAM_ASM_000622 /TAXON_ID=183588 /ORGANISM="Pseudo-nitzschia fraudulenta, Strain WWA7" /LENGTH=522 /DNA_ID=CAMNT_0047403531 /DNA_START=165 /DNA_END=1733 /DNA_ORIENTATION=-
MPPPPGKKKKKPKVKEIDGVLWLLDKDGNPVKKVKKKAKPGENASLHSKEKKKKNVKEINGVLYQLDEKGNPLKKLRRKGAPREPRPEGRQRSSSQGPVAGRRRPRERIATGKQRIRSSSVGKEKQKPGEYLDAKGRKVVIDDDGNKTVYDKKGRKLRPKKKPEAAEPPKRDKLPSLKPTISGRAEAMMTSSLYESGRFNSLWGGEGKPGQVPPSPGNPQSSPGNRRQSELRISGLIGGNGMNGSSAEIEELNNQIKNHEFENKKLKNELNTVEDKVQKLTQQNQKEKSKHMKATTEMLQLKADFQAASDEKRNMELKIKNLEARYREKEEELEKIESTPANRRIQGPGGGDGGSDHLVQQMSDLMAENDALLVKLELAKASSGHDVKKKDEQILFLNEELNKLREENDMLFRGEAEKDPLMGKLLKQKKDLEEKMKQEKQKNSIRLDSMQDSIDTLEKSNVALKKELEKATLAINDEDDEDVRRAKEMAQAVAKHGTGNAQRVKRTTSMDGVQPKRNFLGF